MLTIREIRRRNLKVLEDQAGGRKAFTDQPLAEELKLSYGYIGQLVTDARGIGNSTARKIEKLGNKPEGWLDKAHTELWDLSLQELIELEMSATNSSQEKVITSLVNETGSDKSVIGDVLAGRLSRYSDQALELEVALKTRDQLRRINQAGGNEDQQIKQLVARIKLLPEKDVEFILSVLSLIETRNK